MQLAGTPLPKDFYTQDALEVAPKMLGKILVRTFSDGTQIRLPVSEIEIYRGEEDLACHASRGMTERNRIMFGEGGCIYMYLVYGMHWMFNIVTGPAGHPEALLVRGIGDIFGPGKVTRHLQMDKSFYSEPLFASDRIRIEDAPIVSNFTAGPRVGIHYAGEPWLSIPWRLHL